MEKGEIAQNEQFHPFPQCFLKAFFFIVLEQVYIEVRMKPLPDDDLVPLRKKDFENIVEKGENAGNQPFPTMFSTQ